MVPGGESQEDDGALDGREEPEGQMDVDPEVGFVESVVHTEMIFA